MKIINIFKRKEKVHQTKKTEDTSSYFPYSKLINDKNIKELEKKMVVVEDERKKSPEVILNEFESAVEAYYLLKDYCYSLGENGIKYFNDTWQHCYNSTNPDFDFIDHLNKRYENYKEKCNKKRP